MTTTTRLITIRISHYCEKARWALDRCGIPYEEDGHLPVFHYFACYRAGAGRTVPVLVDGLTVLRDSTDIVAWADAHAPGTLIPTDPAHQVAALALEDDFDQQLGPATRRWAYFHLLPNRDADRYVAEGVPAWERRALRATRPLAVGFLRKGLKADAAGAERSRLKIEAAFAKVDALLADGRRYLVGDRFSVADLTFAALAAPVVLPDRHPLAQTPLALFPPAARDQVETWRVSPAGRFVLGLYADERAKLPRAA
jgi:glutathione S-transferase